MFVFYLIVAWTICDTKMDVYGKIASSKLTDFYVFQNRGTISLNHKSWLLFSVQDLSKISSFMTGLSARMEIVSEKSSNLENNGFQFVSEWVDSNESKIRSLSRRFSTCQKSISDLEQLHGTFGNRAKRYAPLGIVGSILRYIGGVATLEDIENLEGKIDDLMITQNNLVHAQMEALTVMNDSRVFSDRNREKINDIIDRITNISDTISELHDDIEREDTKINRIGLESYMSTFLNEIDSATLFLEEKIREKQEILSSALGI